MRHRTGAFLVSSLLVTAAAGFAPTEAEPAQDKAVSETTYEGTWVTTNRRLDGRMTCIVRDLGGERWSGHFYGVWQGVEFSYRVPFNGPPEKLAGRAQIDGADYVWTGALKAGTPATFDGSFDGSRYRGRFQLAEKGAKK